MESPLLAVPVEILARIFCTCDSFSQVITLALTCKHAQAVWLTNTSAIIWRVGISQVPFFDDALMAVRATAIVLKAYQAGTLPPAIAKITSLSGISRLPELAELKEVWNMQYLVRCMEYMFSNSQFHNHYEADLFIRGSYYQSVRREFRDRLKQNTPGVEKPTIDTFRDGFYRAMYRLLLAGAVLARPYMAPVFPAREERNTRFFLVFADHSFYRSEDIDKLDNADPYATDSDIAYMRQFPVYNFDVSDESTVGQWRDEEYKHCFGPFASWIIEDGRARERNEPRDPDFAMPDWAENREDIGAVRELMLLLVAYDHFNYFFKNHHSPSGPHSDKQGSKTVSIVRFGVFKVEEVTMPAAIEELAARPLSTLFHPAIDGTAGEGLKYEIDIYRALWKLKDHERTDIPYHEEHPGPPPTLELWLFALRHYLNLTFKPWVFWVPDVYNYFHCIWWKEVAGGDIFLNPNWNIVQRYDPKGISWDHRNYQLSVPLVYREITEYDAY